MNYVYSFSKATSTTHKFIVNKDHHTKSITINQKHISSNRVRIYVALNYEHCCHDSLIFVEFVYFFHEK